MRFSIEAEQAVLGALLVDPNIYHDVCDLVSVDDFYSDQHKRIFSHITNLNNKSVVADSQAVVMTLMELGNNDDGVYCVDLANNGTVTNWKTYCLIVTERAQERRIHDAGVSIVEVSKSPEMPLQEKIEALNTIVDGVIDVKVDEIEDYQQILKSVVVDIKAKHEGTHPKGLMTGFKDIDARLEGIQPSDLVIMAGRPGSGKSALAFDIASNVARNDIVVIFTMEMSKKQVLNRILSKISGIPGGRIRSGQLENDEWNILSNAVVMMKALKLIIIDTPAIDVNHATNIVRKISRKEKIGLIVVDYLQLMTNRQEKGGRFEEVSSISRLLKVMAKRFAPVLALSQLSRKVEERQDKRPMLSDLRESGQLEQDADIIMMLYRDDYYNPESPYKGTIEVNTAKFREGEVGVDTLIHQLQYSRFKDISADELSRMAYDRQQEAENKSKKGGGGFR